MCSATPTWRYTVAPSAPPNRSPRAKVTCLAAVTSAMYTAPEQSTAKKVEKMMGKRTPTSSQMRMMQWMPESRSPTSAARPPCAVVQTKISSTDITTTPRTTPTPRRMREPCAPRNAAYTSVQAVRRWQPSPSTARHTKQASMYLPRHSTPSPTMPKHGTASTWRASPYAMQSLQEVT